MEISYDIYIQWIIGVILRYAAVLQTGIHIVIRGL